MSGHCLAFGAGAQTIRAVPMRDGRAVVVASATFEVVDLRFPADSDASVLASGAAAVDAVSTTLSAAGGRGSAYPDRLAVASATGIAAGRRYLLRNGGFSDLVKVEEIDGTLLRLASAVPREYPFGSALVGVELAAEVPDAVTGDEVYLGSGPLLAVRWTPAGLLPFREQIWLERASASPAATPDALLELDPTLASYAGQGMTAAAALAMAHEDWRVDMLSAGLDDAAVLGGPIAASAIRYRGGYHLLKHSPEESAVRRATDWARRYDELRAAVIAGRDRPKVAHVDKGGAAEPPSVRSLFRAKW